MTICQAKEVLKLGSLNYVYEGISSEETGDFYFTYQPGKGAICMDTTL